MTGVPTRVAVQLGTATVRVAAAEAGGEPWLVAELPAPTPGVAALLADLVGSAPAELVLVHPSAWPGARVAHWAGGCAGLAGRVRTVSAAQAAASFVAAGPGAAGPGGDRVVLDVGHSGAEVTHLGLDGAVVACRTCAVGGAVLDEALRTRRAGGSAPRTGDDAAHRAEVRRQREALSLLPAVPVGAEGSAGAEGAAGPARLEASAVRPGLAAALAPVLDTLRAVREAAGPGPVLLVGGVARDPLLAELVDQAGVPGATVVPRPDAAAVLGALVPGAAAPAAVVVPPRPPATAVRPAGTASTPASPGRLRPPPPRRRRPLRALLLATGAAGGAGALVAAGIVLAPAPTAVGLPAGALAQYGYRLDLPSGWEHTGGLPERRRIVLTRHGSPDGGDLIAVERSPLGYDAAAEPERARAELRAQFERAVAAGSALSGYDPEARAGGRPVVGYRQGDGPLVTDWFVAFDGDAQLSVGCRRTASGAAVVRAACDLVVGSVRRG